MESINKETKEVLKAHQDSCDFYLLEKGDDLRKSSVDYFLLWKEFFKKLEDCCPKEEKRKGAKGSTAKAGGLDEAAQAAMKA